MRGDPADADSGVWTADQGIKPKRRVNCDENMSRLQEIY
jgi:hypothetical protein